MMFTTRALIALVALPYVSAQCASGNGCDFEPFYPVKCGSNFECGYDNQCLADSAGYSEADCCTAPQPSACPGVIEPIVCGSKSCPYDNSCLAELSGYSPDQCSPAPPTCGTDTGNCSGEPSNPQKCGAGYTCLYENLCEAEANGYTKDDCCQDTQVDNTACSGEYDPLSCGAPTGKQCSYSNDCLAEAAGYKPSTQCCPAPPEDLACASIAEPPQACGSIPCLYSTTCAAEAAGWSQLDCCPQAVGVCTGEIDSYTCGAGNCEYSSLSCAELAGWTSAECCKQPNEVSSCPSNYEPVTCAKAGCVYANCCVAELAGFDCDSCVAGDFIVQSKGTGDCDSSATAASLVLGVAAAAFGGVVAEL